MRVRNDTDCFWAVVVALGLFTLLSGSAWAQDAPESPNIKLLKQFRERDGSVLRSQRVTSSQTKLGPAAKDASTGKRPNFVVILTDDQGYGDLGCFGGKHVSTPMLDKLAKEGMKLTSFYVTGPICTPSRAGLMTGCYPKRIGMDDGVLLAADRKGLNPEEITIAEVLKPQGYKTGIFGKWHLGDQPEFLPTRQGFDEFWGVPYSHDIHPFHPNQKRFQFPPLPLLSNETVIEEDPDADYLTKRITARWKLHVANTNGTWKALELYNLDTDIGERKDVLAAHPGIARRLIAQIKEFDLDIKQNNRPAGFVKAPKPLRLKNK